MSSTYSLYTIIFLLWQLTNTKFMGIGILVLVTVSELCVIQQSYDVKPHLGTKKYYLLSGILCYQVSC